MNKLILRVLIFALLVSALSLHAWTPARADSCPPHQPVTIDIKPGSDPAPINLNSTGVVPVAVLSTANFDASQFTPQMAHMMDASSPDMTCANTLLRYAYEDVNGDGRTDIVLFFNNQDLGLSSSSTAASLMAHGSYQGITLYITGTDSVTIVQ